MFLNGVQIGAAYVNSLFTVLKNVTDVSAIRYVLTALSDFLRGF